MKKLQLLIVLAFCFAIKLQAQTITTVTVSPTTRCVGASISVPFTITGVFTIGNVFTAQLSDNTGSFTSPVAIGTRVNTTAGTITATVPSATAQGSAYRIRVVSSAPVTTGVMNTTNIVVNALPTTPTITAGGATTFYSGGSVVLTSSTGTTYLWSNGATTQAITATAAGSYTVRVTNASGCQSAASAATVVTIVSTLPPLHFSPQTTLPTWNRAGKVITADVNNDGKQDIVVQNIGYVDYTNGPRNDRVSVFLGNGNGTFQTIINTATGDNINWLGSGYFNSDSRIDFVTPNYEGESISILLGRGDGTFNRQDMSNAPGTMYPLFVITGDVNGDGNIDILTTNQFSSNVSIFLGNGNGTFQYPTPLATSLYPRSIVLGDFNSDGKQDIVVNTYLAGVGLNTLFLGTGTGSFTSNSTIGITGPLTVGDFNMDGFPDIAGIESNVVKVQLGNGNATFSAAQTFSAPGVTDISSADLNGDGFLDLQLPQFDANTIAVLIGNGDGSFNAPLTFAVGTNPMTVASADFNSDGKPDLVVANYYSNNVSILLNTNTAPTLTTIGTLTGATEDIPYTITYTALATAANEFDADGDLISFRVESVSSGILTKNGIAVVAGTTILYPTESLVWTPAANVNGTVSAFTVKAYDGSLLSSTAIQVMTNIDAVNDAPVANAQTIAATENTTYTGTLTGSDIEGNALTYSVVSQGSKGVVTITNATTGAFTYVPNTNANGSDSFTFKVNDGSLDSAPATVTVNITACTPNTGDTTVTACGSFVWYSITYTTSATPTHTFTNVGGCDSVVTLHLTISTTIPSTPIVSVVNNCNGTSILSTTALGTLLWSTAATTSLITVSSAATYTVTQTVNGCVSAAGSGLAAPKTSNSGDTTATACGSFVWYGTTYTSSATPTHTFTNVSGCDSVVTLHLTISTTPATPTVNVLNICNGTSTLSTTASGTLLWSTNETTLTITVSAANTYTVTQTVNACVSAAGSGVAAPKTSNTGDTTVTACGSFVWYSITYTTSATSTHTFTNVSGCDSVVTLHLTINATPATPTVNVLNICNGTSTLSTTASGTLLWSTGATTSTIDVSIAGAYTVTQTVNGCVSAASATFNLAPAASTNVGIDWTTRTSAADNIWNGIVYGNGLFVAVASSGVGNRVMTSPDGITWTARTSAADYNWLNVTYGNGLFVAVSTSGTGNRVMTSPDGITWTSRTTPADNNWFSVTYGNSLFVAVAVTGVGNRVMTSPDGINWTIRTSASDNNWRKVTFGNGLFVAVAASGTGNRVMTSPDGITWTSRTSAADNGWYSVAYGNGLFVAVSSNGVGNRVMTSPDGIIWTIRTSAADNQWFSVFYGNGLFVAVSNTGVGNRVMTSSDGITWTARTSASDNFWSAVNYGNGLFAAVATSGTGTRVMTSGTSTAAVAPVISSATLGSSTTVNFTQSSSASATAITNYEYSTNDGNTWTALSPAATVSPLTITGLAAGTSSIMIRAVNSIGVSCASNKYILCTPNSSIETISACNSYIWHGTTYTASNNIATWTGTSAAGCDSVVTLHLTINATPATPTVSVVNNCNGTSTLSTTASGTLLWSTAATTSPITVSSAGTYTVTTTVNGCLSAVGSGVAAPKTSNTGDTTATACVSFVWYGTTYTSSVTPTHTFTNVSGCDSVVTLHLTINPNLPASVSITSTGNTICAGTSVTFTATPTNGGAYPIYQWKLNGNNVGTNSTTYINSSLVNADVVSVAMTSNDVSTVAIGSKFWTNKNLDVATYRNGDSIPKITVAATWASINYGAYCYYNNDSATYAALYGKLYNWYAVNDSRGLAPTGWHVPTDADWTTLTTTLGGLSVAGGKMKEAGTTHWQYPNMGADNSSGFTGLPGGYRDNGPFANIGTYGYWWSSTEVDATNARNRDLFSGSSDLNIAANNKTFGFSVRCMKDVLNATSACYVNSPATSNSITVTINANTGDTTATACVSFVWYGTTYTSSATPTHTFTNVSGCDSVVTLHLTILPLASVSIAANQTLICAGTAVTFTATATNGGISPIYQWKLNGNNVGVNSATYTNSSLSSTDVVTVAMTPYDGATVNIGSKVWTAKNLDVSTYQNGAPIPRISNSTDWNNQIAGAYTYYNNDSATYAATYGKLYNWYAVTDSRGLAPAGYHIPSKAEWQSMVATLAPNSTPKLQSTSGWTFGSGTNSSGFNGLPGGGYDGNGYMQGIWGIWWTSTEYNFNTANLTLLDRNGVDLGFATETKTHGESVRCISNSPVGISNLCTTTVTSNSITVTINANTGDTTATACVSFVWYGTTYTSSATPTHTFTNVNGCDSVVILNLTITPQPSMPTLACYETATLNTTTCSWDVTGTIPTTPSLACYQTASFNTTTCSWDVTGSQAAAIVTTTSVCSSYTWSANGQPYTQSGTYNYNSNCQDYTLNLTVANVSISSLTPSSSIVGSTVVISGSGFTAATGVSFNGTSATSFTVNSNSQITATVPTGATTGTISVTVNGVCTIVSSTPFTVNASTITLNLNVFVEGFYLGNGLMQSVLFDQNIVTDSTACDYITVELRESLNPSNPVVSSTTTILHIDGTAQITLPSTINGGDYYIVIKNRNSTETWSKVPVTFTSVTTFDFTH